MPAKASAQKANKPAEKPLPPGELKFTGAPLKSVVKRVKTTSGGVTVEYLKFRYKDRDGNTQYCEMPAEESARPRTVDEWISTFDFYQTEAPAQKAAPKKEKPEELIDYPLVSPRPR